MMAAVGMFLSAWAKGATYLCIFFAVFPGKTKKVKITVTLTLEGHL